jgi:hypothetical protein
MDRRLLLASGLALLGAGRALAEPGDGYDDRAAPPRQGDYDRPAPSRRDDDDDGGPRPPRGARPDYRAPTYSQDELVNRASDFFGVAAETVGAVIEKAFHDNGRPTGYIAGEEASGAFVAGARYGKGLLYMKERRPQKVYWRGPSIGFDAGGNGSRTFTLCYDLEYPDMIYRRFPGVDGSAYFIGGMGLNYQRADGVTLAPIRAGVGFRLGANVGYLAYSRDSHWWPF